MNIYLTLKEKMIMLTIFFLFLFSFKMIMINIYVWIEEILRNIIIVLHFNDLDINVIMRMKIDKCHDLIYMLELTENEGKLNIRHE